MGKLCCPSTANVLSGPIQAYSVSRILRQDDAFCKLLKLNVLAGKFCTGFERADLHFGSNPRATGEERHADGSNDLLIAAQVLAIDALLVTHNVR